MAKIIPQSGITGQQGVALIERIVLQMGFLWYPSGQLEAGIDGYIEIRDDITGETTNNIILIQSKAGNSWFRSETSDTFEFLCKEKDLQYWMQGNAPVILVVSRPETDEAYWVSIKDYFKDLNRLKSRKVLFNKSTNNFDSNCKPRLMSLAIPQDCGVYFASPRKDETLYSNLLSVASFAEKLYIAYTECQTNGDVRKKMHTAGDYSSDWILKRKTIMSFRDLEQPPWNEICDIGTIETFDTQEWALSDDPDKQREFVWLLNCCLREKIYEDLRYESMSKYYYFRPTSKLATRSFSYKGPSGKKTDRAVFRGYEDKKNPGKILYYRHSAFKGYFERYGDTWYLEITPTYHFTVDGKELYRYSEDQLSGIKRLEQNQAVLGQINMWTDYLTRPADMFSTPYPYLIFDGLAKFEVDFGIDDDVWLTREGDESKDKSDDSLQPRLF
jgi:hypothetical protein